MGMGLWIATAVLWGCAYKEVRTVSMPAEEPSPTGVNLSVADLAMPTTNPSMVIVAPSPLTAQSSAGGRVSTSIEQHTFTNEGADFDPDIDRTGRLLVFASTCHSNRPDIYVKAIGEPSITQITDDPGSDVQPRVSPDGKRVAFASDRSGNWDIWVTSIDGQNTQQVTRSPAPEVHPDWSPDGNRLVYCSLNVQSRQWELWVIDLRQPGMKKSIGQGLFPRWAPNKEEIVYQRARARGNRWFSVWTIHLVDGEPRLPTEVASSSEFALIAPSWSMDGKRITYCSIEPLSVDTGSVAGHPARGDIWAMDADGRNKFCLTRGEALNYSPVFGPDGRIFFAGNRTGSENIWSLMPVGPVSPVADARTESGGGAPAKARVTGPESKDRAQ